MSNSTSTDPQPRVAAFGEVRRIVSEQRGAKLFDHEAEVLLDAASDMMLASDSGEADDAKEAFDAQMDVLEKSRWAEMVGTEDQPGTATKLRRAFGRCAPDPVAHAA
jgi:hypothetical protein